MKEKYYKNLKMKRILFLNIILFTFVFSLFNFSKIYAATEHWGYIQYQWAGCFPCGGIGGFPPRPNWQCGNNPATDWDDGNTFPPDQCPAGTARKDIDSFHADN